MNDKEFIEKYCHNCGTQRCEGIGTEWFEGCRHKTRTRFFQGARGYCEGRGRGSRYGRGSGGYRMSHLTKAILWLVCSLLMLFCCVINVIEQHWFLLVITSIAFVRDIINTTNEFSAWAREQGRKDAQKKENENDT